MRRPQIRLVYATLYYAFLFPTLIVAAANFECSNIVIDGKTKPWDLSKLGGPHSVTHSYETPPTIRNITFTIDICKDLEIDDSVDKALQCPSGTRVCGIERDDTSKIEKVIPIAGNLRDHNGSDLDAKVTTLTQSDPSLTLKEGIRVELNGGIYVGLKQKAVIEFICDPGSKTESASDSIYKDHVGKRALDDRSNNNASNLTYIKYELDIQEPDKKVLLLEWRTKYVCETQGEDRTQRSHWGFFTWFLIIAFLVTASYLIFGSWLNYNRYGARGWDLLPHGDTIRDIPYLLKDWMRKVMSTVSGSSYRGGYSAV